MRWTYQLKKYFKKDDFLLKFKKVINFFFAFIFLLSYKYYFYNSFTLNYSILDILLLFLIQYFLNININNLLKDKKISYIFGFIISSLLILGQRIYKSNDIHFILSFSNLLIILIQLLGFTKIISEVIYIIMKKILIYDKKNNIKKLWNCFLNKHIFIIIWILIFLSWIPTFLAYYPGILSYDSAVQIRQALKVIPYSQLQPPLHTFFIQICFLISKIIGIEAIVIYEILQMLFLSMVYASLIKFLIQHKVNNWIILFSILFFVINPAISIFSLTITKDVFFSGFFILFLLEFIKVFTNNKVYYNNIWWQIRYSFIILFNCLLRNNAIYIFLLIILLLCFKRNKLKNKIINLTIIPIIIYILIINVLYPFLNIKKDNDVESLSVPIQQISYVIRKHDKKLDNKIKKQINVFFDYEKALKNYNFRFADPVKNMMNNNNYTSYKKDFYKLWLTLFFKYPIDYLSAFLTLNIPYWYPDAKSIDPYSNRKYIEDFIFINFEYYNVKRKSLLPNLLKFYNKFSSFEFVEDKPIINKLYSLSTPLLLLLSSLFVLIYKKCYNLIICILPLDMLLLTYLLGPVSIFRYIFPIFSAYPLIISLTLDSSKFKDKKRSVIYEAKI